MLRVSGTREVAGTVKRRMANPRLARIRTPALWVTGVTSGVIAVLLVIPLVRGLPTRWWWSEHFAVVFNGRSVGLCWNRFGVRLTWVVNLGEHPYGSPVVPRARRAVGVGGETRALDVTIPLWIPTLLMTALAIATLRKVRRRPLPDHCLRCGYNLYALTSNRCPECGEPTPAAGTQGISKPGGGGAPAP